MSSVTDLSTLGLSPQGFTAPRQADVTSALQAQWRTAFGQQVNLDPRSNNGQLINIMAERFALLYELVEAVYNASYPAGAEGVAVDNLLALQGLTRLAALPSKTAASPVTLATGVTLYGLVCYGTAGTVVPKGSLLADTASPANTFATDADIVIGAAQNAVQTLVFNPAPSSGTYALTLTTPAGQAFNTGPLPWNTSASNLEAAIVELGADGPVQPFTDVAVTQAGNVMTVTFGASDPADGQPNNGGQAIPLIVADATGLLAGSTAVTISVFNTVQGQPAQGTGSATCTETGPTTVLAGALSVIQTPASGWAGVTNQLDCDTGSDAESDAEALARRAGLVASQASGPLAAILQRVERVAGVTAAIAVAHSSMASQQILTGGAGATAGSFALTVGGRTTAPVPFNTSAGALQAALRALTGYETATVAGTATSGLTIDWGTSVGGQAVALAQVSQNTTGVAVTQQFGRYPKAVEVVVQGGSDSDVAQAIFAAAPAGLATYGRPVLTTKATTVAGKAAITVTGTSGLKVGLGVQCVGIPPGAQVASIAGNSVTLSAAALASGSNVQATFGYLLPVQDAGGYLQLVRFSRPVAVPVFVTVQLTTDQFNVPGQASSGVNTASQWSAGYVPAIQAAIKQAVSAVSIGGTLSATGTGGIANSFRNVAQGVEDAVVMFDTVPNPTNTARIQLAAEQVPDINLQNIEVSFT